MFTGIIEETGRISEVIADGGGVRLTVEAGSAAVELRVNDSVSINGVCQTVVGKEKNRFCVQAVEETLKKSTLGDLVRGDEVNIELPVRLNERLGGHLVLGHADCVGLITAVEERESSRLITVEFPSQFARYVVPVGSIAIDGISLTVASTGGNHLVVSIIPHTLERTTLSGAKQGMRVNLEFDVIGKYIERLVTGEKPQATLTAEKLKSWGYNA